MSSAAPSRATTCVAISELPPRSKKSSSSPDPVDAEDVGEHAGDDLLDRRRRRPELARVSNTGSGSAFRSSLPAGGQRQLVEHHDRRGTM